MSGEISRLLCRFTHTLASKIHDTTQAFVRPLHGLSHEVRQGTRQEENLDAQSGRYVTASSAGRDSSADRSGLDDPVSVRNAGRSYGPVGAGQLTRHAAGLPLPFHVNTACGQRAEAILSELRHLGVPADALGIARSFVPDLSADGLERAYATSAVMKKDWHADPTFAQRMHADIGRVDPAARTVEFEGVHFTEAEGRHHKEVTVRSAQGDMEWRIKAPGGEQPFCNHTAPTIRMRTADGRETIGVIDPTYDPTRPLSLQEWAARQNEPNVVVLTGSLADRPGTPFHLHTELLTDSQRARFDAISQQHDPSAPNEVMSEFFNLQPEDPHRANLGRDDPDDQYGYSRVLASTILDGNLLPAKIDASGDVAAEVAARLGPVRTYEKWLDATGGT